MFEDESEFELQKNESVAELSNVRRNAFWNQQAQLTSIDQPRRELRSRKKFTL